MERTITYALQFEFTDSEGLEPDAPLLQLEAPNAGASTSSSDSGLSNYEHFARPLHRLDPRRQSSVGRFTEEAAAS